MRLSEKRILKKYIDLNKKCGAALLAPDWYEAKKHRMSQVPYYAEHSDGSFICGPFLLRSLGDEAGKKLLIIKK